MSELQDAVRQAMDLVYNSKPEPTQYIVHPASAAWAKNPVGPAPSCEAVELALAFNMIDGDHPEVQRLMSGLA